MLQDSYHLQLCSQCNQCDLFHESTTDSNSSFNRNTNIKKKQRAISFQPVAMNKNNQIQEKQSTRPVDIFEKMLSDMDAYEKQLSVFCGLWEDSPKRAYRMRFCIEMGELIGYSDGIQSKAFASYDGHVLNMIIVYPKETMRPTDHYRGFLGWNKKSIQWEKEDLSREIGWRPTRRWIKIE